MTQLGREWCIAKAEPYRLMVFDPAGNRGSYMYYVLQRQGLDDTRGKVIRYLDLSNNDEEAKKIFYADYGRKHEKEKGLRENKRSA